MWPLSWMSTLSSWLSLREFCNTMQDCLLDLSRIIYSVFIYRLCILTLIEHLLDVIEKFVILSAEPIRPGRATPLREYMNDAVYD